MRPGSVRTSPWVRCADTVRYALVYRDAWQSVAPVNDLLTLLDVPGTARGSRLHPGIKTYLTREDAVRAAAVNALINDVGF